MPLRQTSLAGVILASSLGSYRAIFSPPHPNPDSAPPTGDTLNRIFSRHFGKALRALFGLLATHTTTLAYFYPDLPPYLLGQGEVYNLDADLVTWSAATSIPLVLIFFVGLPLRLSAFISLGENFTFALKEPNGLKTSGIYRYVQHPGYVGGYVLVLCNVALLGRLDGGLSHFISPQWVQPLLDFQWIMDAAFVCIFTLAIYVRVKEEERMLKAKFGVEWEQWHATTARFIPWIF